MKTIIYSNPFVPAEWIAACGMRAAFGMRAVRVVPRAHDGRRRVGLGPGMCPFACAFVNEVLARADADAVVFTTTCDQMRRAPDLVALHRDIPVFVMNVPATWQPDGAARLYRDELLRLGRFLERLGGKAPSNEDLAAIMLKYDAARACLRSARERLSPRELVEAIAQCDGSDTIETRTGAQREAHGVPLALVGGPLLHEDLVIYDTVERYGGRIVLDATEMGERTLPAPFDREAVSRDALGELVAAYFGTITDAFRRPHSTLYEWLERTLAERGVQGIIFHHYVWCDTWEAEAQPLKERSGVPVVMIDTGDGDGEAHARMAGQVQAFMEALL